MTSSETDSLTWDHVPNFETPEQYHAFAHYRDMGVQRTVSGVARDLGLSPGTVSTWARQGMWRERAASYDAWRIAERDRMRKDAEAQADFDWAQTRAQLVQNQSRIALMAQAKQIDRLSRGQDDYKPGDAARAVREAMHWGQLSEGEATERVDVSGQIDYSALSDEELKALDKVLPRKGTG